MRATRLPNRPIMLMGDSLYGSIGSFWNWASTSPADSTYTIRYRHGGGNPYGHGGSQFNVLWSNFSVSAYGQTTIGKEALFK